MESIKQTKSRPWLVRAALMGWALVAAWGLSAQDADSETVIAAYKVASGQIARAPADQAKIWQFARGLIAPSALARIDRLEFFSAAEDSGGGVSDGYANLDEEGEGWTFGLNLDSATKALEGGGELKAEFAATVLHEAAHVLSMNASQMGAGGLVLDEGTLAASAWLNRFWLTFWKDRYPGRGPETLGDAPAGRLYAQHPADFVSEYSATGPIEDFAESYARFVMEDKPAGTGLKDRKLRFFWDFPELVKDRTALRAGL